MESKFYIGQRVVAIKNHIGGEYKKNDIFQVFDIKKMCCDYCINIQKDGWIGEIICEKCGATEISYGMYHNQSDFAPIQEQEISNFTFEEAIELVTEKQLI